MGSLQPQTVCVIGGGSSGIVAVKECLEAGLRVTCFERADEVGGAWIYEADPGPCTVSFDKDGLAYAYLEGEHDFRAVPKSPMYDGLRTNVPSTLMAYRQRPFDKHVSLFPDAQVVEDYLIKEAEPFRQHIRLSTMVTCLRYWKQGDDAPQRRWYVETRSSHDLEKQPERHSFDFVVLANGHYTKPWIPFLPGLAVWEGQIEHARWFRNEKAYVSKNTLVVGNFASGYDITRIIAIQHLEQRKQDPSAKIPKLYQSARSKSPIGIDLTEPGAPDWAKEVTVVPGITHADSKALYMQGDVRIEDVDLVIFATGYLFSFPFADTAHEPFNQYPLTVPPPLGPTSEAKTSLKEGGLRIHHLDKRQLFYLPDPTLCILAINYLTIPFPLAEAQSKLAATYWSGRAPNLKFEQGIPESAPEETKAHVYGWPKEYDYQDEILAEIGLGGDDEGDKWGRYGQVHKEIRSVAKPLRRAVLGY